MSQVAGSTLYDIRSLLVAGETLTGASVVNANLILDQDKLLYVLETVSGTKSQWIEYDAVTGKMLRTGKDFKE